jgi:pyruvate/2-oxoglutarate dehydrogenase complex dihydrolipoamide acyltransferase (E2) component
MTNVKLVSIILSAIGCLLCQNSLYAGVYKWTDSKGVIHYSDQPNKPNAEKFTLRQNTTTTPRPIKTGGETDEEKKTETAKEPTEPVEKKIPTAEKRKLCNEAKSDIAAISSRGRMREANAKGEYVYLSEKQRQQRISTAKKKQNKYCR